MGPGPHLLQHLQKKRKKRGEKEKEGGKEKKGKEKIILKIRREIVDYISVRQHKSYQWISIKNPSSKEWARIKSHLTKEGQVVGKRTET